MNRVVLCGTFGNGRDYVIWTMETNTERIQELVTRYHLEIGVIRRVERGSDPTIHYYLLAEWENA